MPVRSLNSSVLRWPDLKTVDRAVRTWADAIARLRPEVLRIGYFGSYARGSWGVGSDLDLVVIVDKSELPFVRRGIGWDTDSLPVPTDLLVYTKEEWKALQDKGRFSKMLSSDTVWVHTRE